MQKVVQKWFGDGLEMVESGSEIVQKWLEMARKCIVETRFLNTVVPVLAQYARGFKCKKDWQGFFNR